MSYRITDKKGRTVGYARDQGAELAAAILGGIVLIGLAIVLVPFVIVGAGLYFSGVAFLIYWEWATQIGITPYPNINGVIVVVITGITGAGLVRYLRIHLVLLAALLHMLQLFIIVLVVLIWIAAVIIPALVLIWLPIAIVNWLFWTGLPLIDYRGFAQDTFFWLARKEFLVWLTPLIFPFGWLCALVLSKFDRRGWIVNQSNVEPKVGRNFVVLGIFTWAGMLIMNSSFHVVLRAIDYEPNSWDSNIMFVATSALLGMGMMGTIAGIWHHTILRKPLRRSKT